MENEFYIDGNVIIENATFYAKDIVCSADAATKEGLKVLPSVDGLFKITQDFGSIFSTYYIKGECSAINGEAMCYGSEYNLIFSLYEENMAQIKKKFR